MQIEVGAVLEGKITGIAKFGAFVSLPDGKSGLVHISEVADAFVSDIHEYLSEGQTVKARVLSISPEGKISLSIKKAAERPAAGAAPASAQRRVPAQPKASAQPMAAQSAGYYVPSRSDDQNFEDKLKQFMQDANSRISGNKLFEHQQRSRGRRR